MKYDIDEMMNEIYHKEVKPDEILNQRTLRRMTMKESGDMKKSWSYKRVVATTAVACAVMVGSVGVTYAAINHTSLLSIFQDEDSKVQNTAKNLIETDIKQDKVSDSKQTAYANFSVREAICDKNSVYVQAVAKPAKADYLLVPSECVGELDKVSIENLGIEAENTSETIRQYADRMHKKCVIVNMAIETDAGSQSIDYSTEADGTLVYKFAFENVDKTDSLKYACDTVVYTSEDGSEDSAIRESFDFTLTDKSGDTDTVYYVADSDKVIDGTQLVLDDVTIENGALGMNCIINYHTVDPDAKEWDKWISTDDSSVLFYLLDENGNIIDSKDSSGLKSSGEDGKIVEKDVYSLQELPDTLTFMVKNCMTKEELGTVTVTRK